MKEDENKLKLTFAKIESILQAKLVLQQILGE